MFNVHANTHSHTNEDTYSHADAHSHTNEDAHSHANTHSYTNKDAYSHPDSNRRHDDGDPYSNADQDAYTHSNLHPDTDRLGHPGDMGGHIHGHRCWRESHLRADHGRRRQVLGV